MKAELRRRAQRALARERTDAWIHDRFFADMPLPGLRVDPTGGDPGLVREITALAKTYDLSQESCRKGMPTELFKVLRQRGFDGMHEFVRERALDMDEARSPPPLACAGQFMESLRRVPGEWLFERLPDRYRHGHLLRYHFTVSFEKADFVVRFRNLDFVTTPNGRIYLPPGGHRVAMAGHTWKIAFHKHAMERLSMRLQTNEQPSFAEYTDRWNDLSGSQWHYEPVELTNGVPGVRLLRIIDAENDLSFWHFGYVRNILAKQQFIPSNAKIAIVVGYMPVWLGGRYASAITFLYPGYDTTPEKALINALPWGSPDRSQLLHLIRNANYHQVLEGDAFEATEWFHNNGVPQVWIHTSWA